MSLVYEILDYESSRLIFVEREEIARELCLANEDISYRPIFVAEDLDSAKIELKNKTR